MLTLNYGIDTTFIKPLAKVYVTVVPGFARKGIRTGFNNLREPRYIETDELRYGLGFLGVIESRSDWLGESNLPEDPYVAVRDSYIARREREKADVVEGNGDDASVEPDGG